MEWITENWSFLLQIVAAVFAAIVSFTTFARTGKVTKILKEDQELIKIKTLAEAQKTRPAPTSFSEYKKDYILNEATNELEELPNMINIQKKIESYIDCALNNALERLGLNVVEETDEVLEHYQNSVDDLATLAESMEIAEQWRDELKLPESYSIAQIYEAVDKRAKELKQKLSTATEKKEVKHEEKEVK